MPSPRLRVAQEVHDIVGHGLAAIKMQADIARHALRKRPEQAQTALDVISRTSGEALDELRTTLAVAGYRIVQESLTNVLRRAAATVGRLFSVRAPARS